MSGLVIRVRRHHCSATMPLRNENGCNTATKIKYTYKYIYICASMK